MKPATTGARTGGKPAPARSATTGRAGGVAGPERIEIPMSGLTCPACAQAVEGALRAVAGVRAATVNLASGRAFVTFDPTETGLPSLHAAIRKAGYRVRGARARFGIHGMTCAGLA